MKFICESAPQGLRIPTAALNLSHIPYGEKVELHTLDCALVLLKGQLTAPELISVAKQLHNTAEELYAHLAKVCGPCEDCEESGCPYDALEEESIDLPGYLRQEAGIPEDAKLCAKVHGASGSVIISAAGYRYDLRDVPLELLDIFGDAGSCLGELEEHMILEDIVYGSTMQ